MLVGHLSNELNLKCQELLKLNDKSQKWEEA